MTSDRPTDSTLSPQPNRFAVPLHELEGTRASQAVIGQDVRTLPDQPVPGPQLVVPDAGDGD